MLPRLVVISAVLLLANGCANTITQRVSLSETCQTALDQTAAVPTWEVTETILKARLGETTTCSRDGSKLLMDCAYEDMNRRLALSKRIKGLNDPYTEFQKTVAELRGVLNEELKSSRATMKETSSICNNPKTRRQCAFVIAGNTATLQTKLDLKIAAVYQALIKLSEQMKREGDTLPTDIARELVIWEANVKAQLAGFERALSGDIRVLVVDTGRNELMRYSARRSLDLLHRALRPADAALSKADEKAYGAISFAHVWLGGNMQQAVNDGYDNTLERFKARIAETSVDKAAAVESFQLALQRAACENVSGETEYTILTELVDTMFAMRVTKKLGPAKVNEDKDKDNSPSVSVQGGSGVTAGQTMSGGMEVANGSAEATSGTSKPHSGDADPTVEISPVVLQTYVLHEWAARQMLLERQLASTPERVNENDKRILPAVTPVDEGLVSQLAESAAAVSIDDQLRADPGLLASGPARGVSGASLTAALQSVQQVTTVLSTTVNVKNENTFAPSNNVAPVVNVYPHDPKPNANLCAEGGLHPGIATCMRDGNGYLLRLKTFYDSGTCDNAAVQESMAGLGASVRRHAVTTGQTYYAHVSGYASQRPTDRLQCGIAQKRAEDRCAYWNLAREKVQIGNCSATARVRDVNGLLSAGRATHAAQALEEAADGGLLIKSLAAHGTDGARVHAGNDDVDADRSVVIRLWPSTFR